MESNCRFMKKGLALSAAAMLLALGATGNAQADVIAVSINTITNFSFSGGGNLLESNPNSTASSSATYNATTVSSGTAICPGAGPCNPGGLSANPLQSTAGPGPFPGQDNYTQPPAGGFVGSRGDANVTSVSFNTFGGGAQNVAETRLDAGSTGGANGTNLLSTTIQIVIPSTSTQAITFTFTADPYQQVAIGQAGETAFSNLAVSISLTLGGGQAFLWNPDFNTGNDVGVASQTNPSSLNQTLEANFPTVGILVNPGPGNFSATSVGLGPGTYTLNVNLSETVRGIAAPAAVVPEPSALLLLIAGLAGLAATAARRARPRK